MARRYNLHNARLISSTLLENDEIYELDKSDASEEDALSIDDNCSSEFSAITEEEAQNLDAEEEGAAEREAEPASKRRRLLDSCERVQGRGRPRRSITTSTGEKWSENPPPRRGRRSSGTPNFVASPKLEALDIKSPLDAFSLLFSTNIIEKIVTHTNEEIERERLSLRENNIIIQTYHSGTMITLMTLK